MLRTESAERRGDPPSEKGGRLHAGAGSGGGDRSGGGCDFLHQQRIPFRVLLCGHIDEIGFRVTHITDDGYLQVGKAGGIRLALAQGKRVTVLGRKRLTGVMGLLLRNGEVRTDIELTDLYIDCGFTSRAEALELVAPGDFVTYSYAVDELENDCIAGRGWTTAWAPIPCSTLCCGPGRRGRRWASLRPPPPERRPPCGAPSMQQAGCGPRWLSRWM